jgi:hypothetical protein
MIFLMNIKGGKTETMRGSPAGFTESETADIEPGWLFRDGKRWK